MRYFIANDKGIPYHSQPENGYTKLQVIARVQREIAECVKLYGGNFQDYKDWFTIYDNKWNECRELYQAI